jgi:hypothetical protein
MLNPKQMPHIRKFANPRTMEPPMHMLNSDNEKTTTDLAQWPPFVMIADSSETTPPSGGAVSLALWLFDARDSNL